MSPTRLIVLLTLICQSAMSQSIVVNDSCTGNITTYTRINDSLYAVQAYFRQQPIFKGYLYFPVLNEQYDPEVTTQYDDYYNRTTQTGRCTTWTNHGYIKTISNYQELKKETEKWTFVNGKMETHTLYKPSYYLSEQYDTAGKLTYSNLDDYRDGYGKRTTLLLVKGKMKKFHFVQDLSNGNYYPKNGLIRTYDYEGNLIKEDYYFKHSTRIRKTVYYNDEDMNIYEMDGDGNDIHVETINLATKTTTYLRKTRLFKDSKGFVFDYLRWEEYDTKDTSFIVRRSLKDSSIYAFRYSTDYYIWFKNGLFSANIIKRDTFEQYDRVEYRQKGKHLFIKAWKNGEVKLIRHVAYPDFHSKFQYFPNPVKEIPDQLAYFDYSLSDYTYKYTVNDPDDESEETHYICNFTDSFYTNTQLSGIHTFHDDTIIYYNIINGKRQLAYHSHFLKTVKDINQCATGMKNLQGEWTIPARYDEIRPIFSDTSLIYFCLAGDYTTVYKWDGQLLIPPTKDIITPHKHDGDYDYVWRLSKSLTDSLGLSNNIILQIRNETSNKHRFINLKNELLISLPYRMYVMSDFREDGLENMSFNISDSLGRIGYLDLKGQYFPCKYSLLVPLKNGDRLMRLDSTKDINIITAEHKILDIPPFADYRNLKDNDSLIMLINHDSSFSIYNIYNRQVPIENHHFKLYDNADKNGLFQAHLNGKSGIVNQYLQTVIPLKYTQIFVTGQDYYMCRNADTTDFYTPSGQFANRIVCDTIYHNYNYDFDYYGYPYQVNNYYYRTGRYNSSYWLAYSKNGKFGLMNMGGKLLTDQLYDKIATSTSTDYFIFFQKSSTSTGHLELDTIQIRNNFPAETYLYYQNIINSTDNGIINYQGEVIVTEISSVNTPVSRYGNSSISKDGKLYGIINVMGEWILKSDQYQQCDIRNEDGLAYVTNNEGKAGVIDCSGKEIVKTEHKMISYEPRYHILWHSDLFNLNNVVYNEETHNIWQISNGTKQLRDTLDYPSNFINGYTIVKNRYNYYGIIDSALNVPYGFRFKSYNTIMNNQCILKDSSGQSWLMDGDFKRIKTFKSNKISLLNDTMLMVFNGNMSYTMTISGQVLDSSMNFFAEFPKSTFSTYWNDEDNIEERLSDNEEEYYEDLEENEVEDTDATSQLDTCSDAQINFIKIVNLYMDASESNIYYGKEIFPTPNYQYRDNYYYDYPYELNPGIFTYNIVGFGTLPAYEASRVSLSQFDRFTNLYIDGHSGRLLNYTYNMGRDYNNDLYTNFYFSDNNIVYEFILSDLIEPSKSKEFNQLVIKTLERLELQDIPCYKSPDFIALLNDKMKASKEGIELKVESDISIKLSYEDLKPMMREVWKEKLME